MNLDRISLVSGLILAVCAGCASDPNKKVASAEANVTSAHEKAREDQADLDRKQAAEDARNQNASPDKQAELQRKHQSEQASQDADAKTDITSAQKGVIDARVNLVQDRKDFDAKVEERLEKADAKARELKTKSTKLGGAKATSFRDSYKLYTQQRSQAQAKAKTIKATTDDAWSNNRTDLEAKLDQMESTLSTMGQDL